MVVALGYNLVRLHGLCHPNDVHGEFLMSGKDSVTARIALRTICVHR